MFFNIKHGLFDYHDMSTLSTLIRNRVYSTKRRLIEEYVRSCTLSTQRRNGGLFKQELLTQRNLQPVIVSTYYLL